MSVLIARVEQALVGALLDEEFPWALYAKDVRAVSAARLTSSARRLVFTTAAGLHEDEELRIPGRTLVDVVAERTAYAGITRGGVLRLKWSCPDLTHVPEYSRLLSVARFRQQVATHAELLDAESDHLYEGRADQLRELPAALRRLGRLHPHLLPAPDGEDVAGPAPRPPRVPQDDARAAREERVLFGLLRGDARVVATFLPPESFRDPLRREAYEAIVSLTHAGHAVDSVLVAWEMAERRATGGAQSTADSGLEKPFEATDPMSGGGRVSAGARAEADLSYLDGLPLPRRADALTDARQLLSDDVMAGRYRTATADVGPVTAPDRQHRADLRRQLAPMSRDRASPVEPVLRSPMQRGRTLPGPSQQGPTPRP